MYFYEREYDVYIILGNPTLPPIWTWERWLPVAELVDPLIVAARDRAEVHSTQLRPGSGSLKERTIRFGQIGWNIRGHKKWVHGAPSSDQREEKAEFVEMDVWAPAGTICAREDRAPELFFGIHNEALLRPIQMQFNPLIVLAVARDQEAEVLATGRKAADGLADHVDALVRVYRRRPWGRGLGVGSGFTAPIKDFLWGSVFRLGPRHDRPPSLDMLEEVWETF